MKLRATTEADGKVSVSVRLEEATAEALSELAARNERSIAAEVRIAIRRHLEEAA